MSCLSEEAGVEIMHVWRASPWSPDASAVPFLNQRGTSTPRELPGIPEEPQRDSGEGIVGACGHSQLQAQGGSKRICTFSQPRRKQTWPCLRPAAPSAPGQRL